jgi:two-component system response regulator ResD
MAGYDVALATNGAEGMELLSRNRPELVLLDVLLPDRHGWEVCAQIKRDDTIPVIMLTALGQRDDKLTGLGVGADDYVTKPCSFEELEARVDALLRRTDFMAQAEGLGQPPT